MYGVILDVDGTFNPQDMIRDTLRRIGQSPVRVLATFVVVEIAVTVIRAWTGDGFPNDPMTLRLIALPSLVVGVYLCIFNRRFAEEMTSLNQPWGIKNPQAWNRFMAVLVGVGGVVAAVLILLGVF